MIPQRVLRQKAIIAVLLITLLWAMDWVYVNILVGIYGETGYPGYPHANHGDAFRLLCWGVGLLPLLWMPLTIRRPSQVLTWCMFLMIGLPAAIVAAYETLPASQSFAMIAWVTGGLGIVCASSLLPPLRLPEIHANRELFWLSIFAFSAVAYGVTIYTFGATIHFVNLDEVYLQRAAAFDLGAGALPRYLMAWQETVINPFMMAFGVARRRPWLFLAGALGEVFLFSVAAQRILLVIPVMVLGFHFFLRRGGASFGFRASLASATAFLIPIASVGIGGFAPTVFRLLFDALLNRMYLNGGFLTGLYFKYFHSHPQVGFAEVKPFSLFLRSPYPMSYPEALAWDVWGFYSDPNSNLFADGFAQLGYGGLVIEALGLAFIFWLLDSITRQRKISVWLAAMCCAAQVSSVVNAATSNILVGEGFWLVLLLFAVLPRSEATAVWTEAPARAAEAPIAAMAAT